MLVSFSRGRLPKATARYPSNGPGSPDLRTSVPIDWTWPIARFRRATDKLHVGAGALVAGDVVITCAHVVKDALHGSDQKPEVGALLSLDFPFANIYSLKAKVTTWCPEIPESERRRDGSPSDLAVLTL